MELSLSVAFVGGLLTLLAPCSALLLPGFFAFAFDSRRVLLGRTALFFVGLLLGLVPLGAALGAVGTFLAGHIESVTLWCALIIVAIGFWQMLALPVPAHPLSRAGAGVKKSSALGVVLLGFVYGLAGTGCSGPILGAVSQFIISGGSPWAGAVTMVAYSCGVFTPVVILALVWDYARIPQRRWLQPRPVTILGRTTTVGQIVSGAVFVILGVVMMTVGGGKLSSSLMDPVTQAEIENTVRIALAGVPNWLFGVLAVLVGATLWVWVKHRR